MSRGETLKSAPTCSKQVATPRLRRPMRRPAVAGRSWKETMQASSLAAPVTPLPVAVAGIVEAILRLEKPKARRRLLRSLHAIALEMKARSTIVRIVDARGRPAALSEAAEAIIDAIRLVPSLRHVDAALADFCAELVL